MSEATHFLLAPFVMCVLLVGIHCYLGLHVLARGVIFVDLSLAQVASLGAAVALFYEMDHDSSISYFTSLGFTFMAASLFAVARQYEKYFSQEAIIGIVYALSSAAIVLVIDRMAHGAEHLKEAMIGQVLWVNWQEVRTTAMIYSGVGIVHFIFRKQMLRASFEQTGHFVWDLLFYCLFGVVITSSVHVAGVLMVFSYLIVPSILSTLFFETVRMRLLFGWVLGSILSLIGLAASYKWDFPAGAFIVVEFTLMPLLFLFILPLGTRFRFQK